MMHTISNLGFCDAEQSKLVALPGWKLHDDDDGDDDDSTVARQTANSEKRRGHKDAATRNKERIELFICGRTSQQNPDKAQVLEPILHH